MCFRGLSKEKQLIIDVLNLADEVPTPDYLNNLDWSFIVREILKVNVAFLF